MGGGGSEYGMVHLLVCMSDMCVTVGLCVCGGGGRGGLETLAEGSLSETITILGHFSLFYAYSDK